MNLTYTVSLEQRALTNIAITLWSQDDTKHLLSKYLLHALKNRWKIIEKAVLEKSLKLPLPDILKDKLLHCIVRVGSQIISWVEFHYCDCDFITLLPAMFVWTSLGTINNIKTAKLLVMNGTLDRNACFALACMYCLEDEIKYCWNMFGFSLHTSNFDCLHFVSYWSDYMNKFNRMEFKMEKYSSDSNPYRCIILESVRHGNEAATRYFFQKVNMKEDNFVMVLAEVVVSKIFTFKELITLERYSGVMLFLLSEMNAEQQADMFSKYPSAVLMCLLVWPWQSLFLEMVNGNYNFLSEDSYDYLLHVMVEMMGENYNLHEVFEEFWQQSPNSYKRFVTEKGDIHRLILHLYRNGDDENVRLILKHTRISIRERIITFGGSERIFVYLVSSEKWNIIEFLIQECLSSVNHFIIMKDLMRRYVTELQDESVREYQWDKFFHIFDCCIFKYNKKAEHKTRTSIHHISKEH